jgi:hypothetical protein
MTSRKKPGVAFWASVVVACVLGAICVYFGAYFSMIEPIELPDPAHPTWERPACYVWRGKVVKGFWGVTFFQPAHAVDLKIRRKYWFGD